MHIPDYSYKNAGIDKFYYSHTDLGSTSVIPLIKPLKISNIGSPKEWYLNTYTAKINNEMEWRKPMGLQDTTKRNNLFIIGVQKEKRERKE